MIINASLPSSGGVKLASGSYVGTGTYGVDNKNTVNVGFAPKLFLFFTMILLRYLHTTAFGKKDVIP